MSRQEHSDTTHLEELASSGLDLTLRSLAGIAKYPWLKGEHPIGNEKLSRKWSFYPEERRVLQELEQNNFIKVHKNGKEVTCVQRWVEAEIMDWADDISYAVHDLDDFYRAGLIPLGSVLEGIKEAAEHLNAFNDDLAAVPYISDYQVGQALNYAREIIKKFAMESHPKIIFDASTFQKTLKQIIGLFTNSTGLRLSSKFTGTRSAHIALRVFSSTLIRHLSDATSLETGSGRVQLVISDEARLIAEFFKAINIYYVRNTVIISTLQNGQMAILEELYHKIENLTLDWMKKTGDKLDDRTLPARLRSYIADDWILNPNARENTSQPENQQTTISRFTRSKLAVLDYVAGLSDRQVVALMERLSGSKNLPALAGRWLDT